jgi:hypothetical protein
VEVAGEPRDLSDVTFLGAYGKIADLQVLNHALTKRRHGKLLCELKWAASSQFMFSQRNLQADENLYTKTVVRVIRSGTAVTALPNTAKRFSPTAFTRT